MKVYGASKKVQDARITKAEVVYVEPKLGQGHHFAQCATCRWWHAGQQRCALLGPAIVVDGNDTCAMYTPGPTGDGTIKASFTPAEVGFVKDTQVRCENCRWGGSGTCKRFGFPISATGCCDAWRSK